MSRPFTRELPFCPRCGSVFSWDYGLVRHCDPSEEVSIVHVRLRKPAMQTDADPSTQPLRELAWVGKSRPKR